MLDGPESATDNGDAFDRVISEMWTAPTTDVSPQWDAEVLAFWKAMGLLVPRAHRDALISSWKIAHDSNPESANYSVAKKLLIPAFYVPAIFSPTFDRMVDGFFD